MGAIVLSLMAAIAVSSPKVDALGDPLPPGVMARLGSVRWRTPESPMSLHFTPNGRLLVERMPERFVVWSYPDGRQVSTFRLPFVPKSGLEEPEEPWRIAADQIRFGRDNRTATIHFGWDKLCRVQLLTGACETLINGDRLQACGASTDGRRRLAISAPIHTENAAHAHLIVRGPAVARQNGKLATLQITADTGWAGCSGPHGASAARPILSADGRFAVAGFVARRMEIPQVVGGFVAFDLTTGQAWTITHGPSVELSFAPDGRTLLAADWRSLAIWRFVAGPDGRSKFQFVAKGRIPGEDGGQPESACFSPDGRRLAVFGIGAKVYVFNSATLNLVRTICLPRGIGGSGGLAIAPDNRTLAVPLNVPPVIAFFDLETGRRLRGTMGHVASIENLEFASTGQRLVSRCADESVRHWDVPARSDRWRNERDEFKRNEPRYAQPRYLVRCLSGHGRVEVIDTVAQQTRSFPEPAFGNGASIESELSLGAAALDARTLAYSLNCAVIVRDFDTWEEIARFERNDDVSASAVALSRTGDLLAIGYDDGQILLYDLRSARSRSTTPSQLWADLGGDAFTSRRAAARLLCDSTATLTLFAERLQPAPPPSQDDVCAWVAELEHSRYAARERATRKLTQHYHTAKSVLNIAATLAGSTEFQERLKRIAAAASRPESDPDVLRLIRACAVLEQIPEQRATDLLRLVAAGRGLPAARAGDALTRRTPMR